MRKGNVYMFEREVVFGELLEAEDVCVFGCVFDPRSLFDEAGADLIRQKVVRNYGCVELVG